MSPPLESPSADARALDARALDAQTLAAIDDPVVRSLLRALPELWARYAELCADDEEPGTETVFADVADLVSELVARDGQDDRTRLVTILDVMAHFAECEGPEASWAVIVGFVESLDQPSLTAAIEYLGPDAGLLFRALFEAQRGCLDELEELGQLDPDSLLGLEDDVLEDDDLEDDDLGGVPRGVPGDRQP